MQISKCHSTSLDARVPSTSIPASLIFVSLARVVSRLSRVRTSLSFLLAMLESAITKRSVRRIPGRRERWVRTKEVGRNKPGGAGSVSGLSRADDWRWSLRCKYLAELARWSSAADGLPPQRLPFVRETCYTSLLVKAARGSHAEGTAAYSMHNSCGSCVDRGDARRRPTVTWSTGLRQQPVLRDAQLL